MQQKLFSLLFPATLVLISLILCFINYTPGTFLTGWDTLHPEFNFSLNLERLIFGVFRDEQGLGAVAGHSHMADLPRVITLFIFNLFLPLSFLRYSWIFLCVILGTLGTYLFLNRLGKIPAFLGALLYLLNLGTLQHFYVPFEMFPTQFAALPFLFLYALRFLETRKTNYLLIFSFVTLLSTPMAYAGTLWYAYFLCFSLFLLTYNLFLKNRLILKASLKIIAVTLFINSFWILPNLYFIGTHAKEVSQSKIHSLFTEEAFAQNASFGTLPDIALYKNYLFNWGEYIGNNNFGPLLDEWSKHLENPFVSFLGYLYFLIVIVGIVFAIKSKNVFALSFLPLFILCIFFLLNVNPPLGFMFQFLQDNIPLLREALRFPFNKFSIVLMLVSSIYFAYSISFLKRKQILLFIIITLSLFYYMWPAFQGNFISKSMRVSIPREYFDLFKYFDGEKPGRVAVLPIHSFWGWVYNDWGYQGAGFLWFGIKQSFLDRDFDRWQKYNEQYYREMSYALYSQNTNLLNNVIRKYNISHILIDKSVLPAGQDPKTLFVNEIEELLKSNSTVLKDKEFGKLAVYKTDPKIHSQLFIVKNYKSVAPAITASYEDIAFNNYGHYAYSDSANLIFPFADLIDNQNKIISGKVDISQEGITLPLPEEALKRNLVIPNYSALEKLFAVDLLVEKRINSLKISLIPNFPRSESPIVLTTNLPAGENNFLLSINQKDNFTLNNLGDNTPLVLGTTFLKTNEENTISLYRDKDDLVFKPDISNLSLDLRPCENGQIQGTFGMTPKGNNFEIYADKTIACLTLPLSLLQSYFPSNQGLIGISFNSRSPSFCISDLRNQNCQDFDLRNISLDPVTQTKVNSFFEVKPSDFQNLGIKFFLDAKEGAKQTSYNDISFSFKRPILNVPFSKEVGQSLDNFKLDNSFKIPFSGNAELSLDITKLPKTGGDCPQGPGVIAQAKKEIVKKDFENYIRYKAEEGSFCDHFSYENLQPDQSYVIIIKARNVAGLPARLCVANRSNKRCDIYAHLEKSKEFTNNIFLLPPTKSKENGFDININNFAVKDIPSINDLASITIVPFPYSWLTQIESQSPSGKSSVFNIPEAKISSPNKTVFELKGPLTRGDLLVLPQSFEKGWKAFVDGKELKNHVTADNWSNGWILDRDIPSGSKITIQFLPQNLEYLGFILSFGTIAYLFTKRNEL